MNAKRWVFRVLPTVFLCCGFSSAALSQQEHRSGLLTALNFNKRISSGLAFNFKAENRQLFWHGQGLAPHAWDYAYERTDLASMLVFPLGLGFKGGAGYMFRTLPGARLHRFSAQATTTGNLNRARLGHRLLADHSLREGAPPSSRLRYRAMLELPLGGASLNPGEFYLKTGAELLGIGSAGLLGWEARALGGLGRQIAAGHMLEQGFDLRWGGPFGQVEEGQYWLTLAWFGSW